MIAWTKDPYLLAAKVCATLLHEDGLRGKALAAKVREHFPRLEAVAGREVPDGTIAQRGDKGVRYRSEHYSAHPVASAFADLLRDHIRLGLAWE